MLPITSIFHVDPNRLYAASEYPRYVVKPHDHLLEQYDILADYAIEVIYPKGTPYCECKVYLQPNDHTCAKHPRMIYHVYVAYWKSIDRRFYDEILDRAFQPKN